MSVAKVTGLQAFDEDDTVIIDALIQKGRTAKEISKKLKVDEKQVQEYMNKRDFSEESFEQLCQWLEKMTLGKYKDVFRGLGYDSMKKLMALEKSDLQKTLLSANVKSGSVYKLMSAVAAYKVYSDQPGVPAEEVYSVAEIINIPKPIDWSPSENDLNLTEEFKKSDGTSSISHTVKTILDGYIPKNVIVKGKKEEFEFYCKSTNHNRYFSITVKWKGQN